MFLDLVLCSHSRSKQGVDEVLENLPEEKEVVALCNHEFHLEVRLLFRPLARLVVKLLQGALILLSDRLIHFEHRQHQVFYLFDSDDLKSLVK